MNAPHRPAWQEVGRIVHEGIVGIILLPSHEDMAQEIRYKIFGPHGYPIYEPEELVFIPPVGETFADLADPVKAAAEHLHQLLASAKGQ